MSNTMPGLCNAFQSLKVQDEVDQREKHNEKNLIRSTNSVLTRPPVTPHLTSSAKSKLPFSCKTVSNNQTGMVSEETFIDSFEKVPAVQIYSGKDVDECLKKYHDILKDKNEDWENRVDCLKKIRSLILANALKYDEFYENLNRLLPAFHAAIDDLRSMVVREACITVAFLSKNLEHKFDHFAESVLSNLMNLIQKSQKIFASSGLVCIRFILLQTHAPRLIPIITNHLNSKSKEIRRACCEFISLILQTWPIHTIERYASTVQEAIKKGIVDADPDARIHSRKAYSEFAQHFPELAESLKNSLDFSYRKLLLSGSNSGSNSSLSKFVGSGCSDQKSSIPRSVNTVSLRSNSAIDLQAAQRAKTRAQYAAMSRQKFGATTTVSRTKTPTLTLSSPSSSSTTAPSAVIESRVGRTKNRISVSQPTSRSGSPSSRFSSYSHYLASGGAVSRSRKSSIGNDTSRETSPNRSHASSTFGYKGRVSTQPVRRPVIAQKILQQSREAETQLADALGNISDLSPYSFRPASRHLFRTPDDHSDESETSSVSSEHSFDSYRRPSDSMSWNGSQHRLYRELGDSPLKHIGDIITYCESSHWSDRKKGLIGLQYYIQEGNKLELPDLKRIMDLFLKIFNDPHIKVFSLFLDTLNELILSHSVDLCFCLHLLLTRLFNKLGTDLLNSVHSKIMKTLDNVFTVFPHDLQLQSVFRFLVDPTQTPNNRVKQAALNYIVRLTSVVDPCAAFSSNSQNKDYVSMALIKIISWTMTDNVKTSPELRKAAQEAVLALFNLNTSQVTRRFATMPTDYQEAAASICKNKCSPLSSSNSNSNSHSPASLDSSTDVNISRGSSASKFGSGKADSLPDTSYKSFCRSLPSDVNNHVSHDTSELRKSFRRTGAAVGELQKFNHDSSCTTAITDTDGKTNNCDTSENDSETLKACIDELSQTNDSLQMKHDLLIKITKLVQESSSNAIISNFKPLLGKIISFMTSAEPAAIKEIVLNLLQLLVKRKTVTFLLKQFSDLVITKVLALCGDSSKDVVKAAENCAITLSTHLPPESVVRIIVPLITSEAAPVKLIAIKMLTRLVECSDDSVTLANIDQIMPVLLVAYDDTESSVRKAAVFSMVALYKQSDEMKFALEPYISKLQGAKLKLLQLYIHRAEQGMSVPTSPKNS